jgi:hypothetical protein
LKIDKDIPLCDPGHSGPQNPKYPLRAMDVGDSFLVPTKQDRERAKATIWYFTRSSLGKGRKFASRKVEEGYRIWRIL